MKNLILKSIFFSLTFLMTLTLKSQSFIDYDINNQTDCSIDVTFKTTLGNYTVTIPANTNSIVGCNAFPGIPTYVQLDDGASVYNMPPQSGGYYNCSFYGGSCTGSTCLTTTTSTGFSAFGTSGMGTCNGGVGSGIYSFSIDITP